MRAVVFLVLPLLSCDLLPGDRITAHCDLRVGIEPTGYCQEWRELLSAPGSDVTARGVCAALGTEYVPTECPDEDDIVAGCFIGNLGDGSASYHWYYDVDEDGNDINMDDVRSECGTDEFVEWFPTE